MCYTVPYDEQTPKLIGVASFEPTDECEEPPMPE